MNVWTKNLQRDKGNEVSMKKALEWKLERHESDTHSVLCISQCPRPWTLGGNESNKDPKLQARQLFNGENQWQPCWPLGLKLIEIDTLIIRRMKSGKQYEHCHISTGEQPSTFVALIDCSSWSYASLLSFKNNLKSKQTKVFYKPLQMYTHFLQLSPEYS